MDLTAQRLVSRPARRGLGAFIEGFLVPWEGAIYLMARPGLLPFAILPAAVHFVLSLGLIYGLYRGWVAVWVWSSTWLGDAWYSVALEKAGAIGLCILLLAGGVGTALLLGVILCSLFYPILARRTERAIGVAEGELRDVSIFREVRDTLLNFAELVVVNLFILALNLVPAVGSLVAGAVSYYFNCFIFGLEYLDYPLALRGRERREKRVFAKAHRMNTLGLGTAVFLFQLLPLIGSFLLATAVVGSVFLHRRLQRASRGV